MFQETIKIKPLVEQILKDFPETRNSDKRLFLKVVGHFGLNFTKEQEKVFLSLPINFESVRRCRQIIQNTEGRFRPVSEVKQARNNAGDEMRERMKNKPKGLTEKELAELGCFG